MSRFSRLVLAVATTLALAASLAACSGSGSGGTKPSGPQTYTNDKYGFTITYDPMFVKGAPEDGASSGGSSVFDIAFADANGAQVDDKYVDGIEVSVYKLTRAVKAAEVPKLKQEFQNVVNQMLKGLSGATAVKPLATVTLGGAPGFKLTYIYNQGSTSIAAITYFLVKGQYEYQLTAQASQQNWNKLSSKLQAAVESFRLQ
jgi:hypothetical protein